MIYACYCRVVGAGQLACPVMPAQAWCGAPLLPCTQTPLLSLNNYCSVVVCPDLLMQAPPNCTSHPMHLLCIAVRLESQYPTDVLQCYTLTGHVPVSLVFDILSLRAFVILSMQTM